MDFSDILDEIARPAPAEDAVLRPNASAAAMEFWQVLDRLAEAPPVSEERLKDAYFSETFAAAALLDDAGTEPSELSLDPDDVAFELDLPSAVSLEELASLRRKFAMLNHPDRMPAEFRERANTRMTIANALIDEAEARFSR